jgi:SAM-dependent methyltransferase
VNVTTTTDPFPSAPPAPPVSAMDATYAARYGDLHARHWWWRSREEYVVRKVRALAAGRRLQILDIGCGNGLAWKALAPFGDIEGIEPDAGLLPPDSPHRARIEISTFPGRPRSQKYDLILMLDVLEHIEDDKAALAAAWDLLAPGGHLLLTVPALMLLWSEFDALNRHHRRYRKGPLAAQLAGAGFEVLSNRYYFFWSALPLLGRRLLFRAKNAENTSFINVPPAPVNRLLHLASTVDHHITSRLPAPFGSSLIAVARKPLA